MFSLKDTESALIAGIYDAALNPEHWWKLLKDLSEAIQTEQCHLIFYDTANHKRNQGYSSAIHVVGSMEDYYADMIHRDFNQVYAAHKHLADGQLCNRLESLSDVDTQLKDFLLGQVRHFDQVGARLFEVNHSSAWLSICREFGRPRFEPEVIQLIQALSPHLCRAMRIHHQLRFTRHEYLKLQLALDKTAAGIVLLDDNARISIANHEAARLLSDHPAVRIGANGRIQAACKKADTAFQVLIEQALVASHQPSVLQQIDPSMPLSCSERSHPLKLSVVPLRSANLNCADEYRGISVAIFLTDPERRWHVSEDYLHHAYELTPAECSVAQVLVNGGDVNAITEERGTTENTVRWQLKKIMEKTATHSQAELMRTLIALSEDFAIPVA